MQRTNITIPTFMLNAHLREQVLYIKEVLTQPRSQGGNLFNFNAQKGIAIFNPPLLSEMYLKANGCKLSSKPNCHSLLRGLKQPSFLTQAQQLKHITCLILTQKSSSKNKDGFRI
ncbi:Hypothetical_protein [Hexamita inflata]|uniref:Hypothetical_protein n=1 Tax=Hexamita inflata TaxID=28002 RepID=A0AA86UYX8_9EUKA|nr:Hypothetical protein HINF_LOCUS65250 [Hexamita inflata]